MEAVRQGSSKRSHESSYVLLTFAISSLFGGLLIHLMPYLMCLLCGSRLNGSLNHGDPLLRLNAERCVDTHRLLEREGRRYRHNLVMVVKGMLAAGLVQRTVDLSTDPTHLVYWGKKMVRRWGAVFSTMHNRAIPGLFPLTCFDLKSGLFLWMDDFIGRARRDRRGRMKNPGSVVAAKVLKCVGHLSQDTGIRIRSVIGDEGIASVHLIKELEKRGIKKHLFALRSNSRLGSLVPSIEKWAKLGDGRRVGIKRGVMYHGVRTNLVVVKDDDRTYLYVSGYHKGAKYAWRRFSKRGKHENGIGVVKSIGLEDRRPSTNLFQVKGHALSCIYLMALLKALCRSLNLGENFEPRTVKNLFSRECYVRWDGGNMFALVVVSRTLMAKIGRQRIEWEGGVIEFLWHQDRRGALSKIDAKG